MTASPPASLVTGNSTRLSVCRPAFHLMSLRRIQALPEATTPSIRTVLEIPLPAPPQTPRITRAATPQGSSLIVRPLLSLLQAPSEPAVHACSMDPEAKT